MNYEEKINELENRIVELEKIEKRRRIKNIIIYSLYGAIILSTIIIVCVIYYKLKPYKDELDSLKNFGSGLKSDTIIDGSNDYNDFFNYFFNY